MLILGAGGFLGYSFCSFLSANAHTYVTLSRSFQWLQLPGEERFIAPVSLLSNIALDWRAIDSIIFMSGTTNLKDVECDPARNISSHVLDMELFFDAIRKAPASPRLLLFFSSAGTVYGDSGKIKKSEISELLPKSAYGRRNVVLEALFSVCAKSLQIPYSILRISNPFGPSQYLFRRKGLVYTLIMSAIRGDKVTLVANGKHSRDYLYSPMMSRIIYELIGSDSLPPVLNIASGFSYTARELISTLEEFSLNPNVDYKDSGEEYDVADSLLDNARLLALLDIEKEKLSPFSHQNLQDVVDDIMLGLGQ